MAISTSRSVLILIAATGAMLAIGMTWTPDHSDEEMPIALGPVRITPQSTVAAALLAAVQDGDVAGVQAALAADPGLAKVRLGEEGTALHMAARLNQPTIVAALIESGADVTARGQWGGTPLHWAAWWGSRQAADELIRRGAPVEVKGDAFGSTPLLWAAHGSAFVRNPAGDYVGLVQRLLEVGAVADTINDAGQPAIIMANREVAALLKAHGAKIPREQDLQPLPRPDRQPGRMRSRANPAQVV